MSRFWCLLFALVPVELLAQLPDQFSDQVLSTAFDFPVGITFDAAGRGYVWEKGGKVWIVDEDGGKADQPLVDISEEVGHWRDHGMLGFALDPDFIENGYLYLLYAVDHHYLFEYGTSDYHPDTTDILAPSIGRITRYTADPATDRQTLLPDSRHIVLGEGPGTSFLFVHESHGVGALVFAKDGSLLVSCGDGNSFEGPDSGGDEWNNYIDAAYADGLLTPEEDIGQFKSQSLLSHNGKILRIDAATGAGLASNPFYDPAAPRSARSRTWALGFRNPYRFTVRPGTGSHDPAQGDPGALYIGDVGEGSWEELNVAVTGGQNFGWPLNEGYHDAYHYARLVPPANPLAPNPLHAQHDCEQAFFTYRDVYHRAAGPDQVSYPNPCDPAQQIPTSVTRFVETWPVLAWSNHTTNPPARTEVGRLRPDGTRERYQTDDPAAFVQTDMFSGNASMGGLFYTGGNFPAAYEGKYFHVDYRGWIRVFTFNDAQELVDVAPFHTGTGDIFHLAQHPLSGKLYYLNLQGRLHRIEYGGNPPPVIVAVADTTYGAPPLSVQFDASASYAPLGHPLTFAWDFGNGQTSNAPAPAVRFTGDGSPRRIDVQLTVTDTTQTSAQQTLPIYLNNTPPEITFTSATAGDRYPTDRTTVLRLAAEAVDAEHAAADLRYTWTAYIHHKDHFHREPADTARQTHFLVSPLGCGDEAFWYRISLQVTDPLGLSATREFELYPNCDDPLTAVGPLMATLEATGRPLLDWTYQGGPTGTEMTVQRSTDQLRWEVLNTQRSTAASAYAYTDAAAPVGRLYYRVKLRAPDGRYDYTNIVELQYPRRPEMLLFPNPATNAVNVYLARPAAPTARLELFDAAGRAQLLRELSVPIDQPFEQQIAVAHLPPGVYGYRLQCGAALQTGLLVIAGR